MLGGSVSWSMDETWVGVWIVSLLVPGSGGRLCEGGVVDSFLLLRRLASLRSFVRRLSCLLSALVRGVCSFSVFGGVCVCVALASFSVLVRGKCLAW